MAGQPKFVTDRSPEEMAHIAQYRAQRASVRPKGCIGGDKCWVELGPLGWSTANSGNCIGCHEIPGILAFDDGRRLPRRKKGQA